MLTMIAFMTMSVSTFALSFSTSREEALFLTDKMAYELSLNAYQYDAVYEINFDYFYSMDSYNNVYGMYWKRRNADMEFVLNSFQYNLYIHTPYFYRPLRWNNNNWTFSIYGVYTSRTQLYFGKTSIYNTFRGGRNKVSVSYYKGRNYSGSPLHPVNPRVDYLGVSRRSYNLQQMDEYNRKYNKNTPSRFDIDHQRGTVPQPHSTTNGWNSHSGTTNHSGNNNGVHKGNGYNNNNGNRPSTSNGNKTQSTTGNGHLGGKRF